MPTNNTVRRPWIKYSEQQGQKKTDPFYYSTLWRKAREYHLKLNPLCYYCGLFGLTHFGTIVDHEMPRKYFPHLELVGDNFRTSCDHAHNIKRVCEKEMTSPLQQDSMMKTFIERLSKHIKHTA